MINAFKPWAVALLALLPVVALAAPKYIDFKPLDEVVKTPVANVAGGAKVLPIITWGGDIATIHGNGDQAATRPGSIFALHNLDYRLQRQDVFATQVENYLAGKTPFLRGTLGMINTAADVLSKDPRTKPVVFYQMTWSAGGDALVVKDAIKTAADLRGKTIAVQAYGPHVDYLLRVLKDSGLRYSDVTVKWLPDLTGTDNSPMAALYENNVDAAFVIIPDALALTSGGNVGTGSEDSVRGARILMSTKTANRVIADVYAVRSDYYQANRGEIERLTKALIAAEQDLAKVVSERSSRAQAYNSVMAASAQLLLDSAAAISDTEGLFADCEFVRFDGNVKFFSDANYPRSFERVSSEIQASLQPLGLINGNNKIAHANLNYKQLDAGFSTASIPERPRFDKDEVASLITRKQQQGSLSEGELFRFEVFFGPNQNSFSIELYKADFDKVVDLASTYGGAIITIEGHSDPMGYLRSKQDGETSVVLGRIKQSAKNLSVSRAQTVRDAIIDYAQNQSVALDSSQFEPIGHGITQPNTGICGEDPCAPKNEQEWRSNMRVVFRIIQVEAESSVFQPL
jgi:ABC-type nitrate/sulfonate/bicarbonate transport system substrate-binding protein/outer membrane protein OmpA-like peptidoglycan-associated protein